MSTEDRNELEGTTKNPTPDLRDLANRELNEGISRAKEDLDAISEQAASDVRELGQQAQEKIGEATENVKSFAGTQKDLAASQMKGVADALSKVASELEGTDQQNVGRYARDLANGLSNFGKQIESRDVDDLLAAAQDFGRTQPVAFLGMAALAGFAASRFALASSHRHKTQAQTGASQQSRAKNAKSEAFKGDSGQGEPAGGM